MSRLANNRLGGFGASKASYEQSTTEPIKENKGSSNGYSFSSNDMVPKRFAVKYDPPTIIMEYLVPSSGKLYHHKMRVHDISYDSDTSDVLSNLKDKHYQYFLGNKISDPQMKNFIERLKRNLQENGKTSGNSKSEALKESQGGSGLVGKLASLNSNSATKQNNDRGYPLVSSDLNQNKATPTSKGLTSKDNSDNKKKGGDSNGFWEFEDLDDLDDKEDNKESGSQPGSQVFDYHNLNLNKLSSDEVQKHKSKMDILFNKNNSRPGDDDFEYDRQEEFSPVDAHEWDDEDF